MNNVTSVLIFSNFLAAVVFVVSYQRKANWRATAMGRHVMSFMVVVALAFGLGVLTVLFGSDYVGREYVRALVQAVITFVLWWRVVLLYKIQHDGGSVVTYDNGERVLPAIPNADSPSEPLGPVALVSGLATSVLALLVAFNVPLTDMQEKAILGVVPFVVGTVVWLWGRRRVFSPKTVHRMFAQVTANRSRFTAQVQEAATRADGGVTLWDEPPGPVTR